MPVADLLQWLANNRSTGTLVISDGTADKSIFFKYGIIISSASTVPTEFLGHFLVSHGFLDEQQLADAMARQKECKALLGKILVDRGLISTADLEQMLRLKAEETIYDLFTWSDGEFHFVDDELPPYKMIPVSMSVTGLLLEGMQRIDEWEEIRAVIPSSLTVLVAVADLLEGAAEDGADDGERAILAAVNDDRCIEEICLQTHSSEFRVSKLLHQQHQAGKLKLVRPRVASTMPVTAATNAADLLTQARLHLEQQSLDLALRYTRAALSLEPDSHGTRTEVRQLEEELRRCLDADGIGPEAVPRLAASPAELTSLDLSPEEGFILSRINGSSPVATIVKISPIPELEATMVIWKLARGGHIVLARGERG